MPGLGAERQSSTIGREPDHAVSGQLQELIKLREGRLAGGLERSDRMKSPGISAGAFCLKV